MNDQELIPHLFRTEFRKIAAVLCKHFGMEHLETAEDIAGETFLAALETWPYKGVPENPVAWLYSVAKNKARNTLGRKQVFQEKITAELKAEIIAAEIDLSEQNITDSQLQMLFAVCHPSIPAEAQIGLALRILCGFGIGEIATALLSNKEAVQKQLYRAKEKLREEKVQIVFPAEPEISKRLETVLRTLYLLFSEGYYSESHDHVLRRELCLEAMRLNYLLIENENTNQPAVNALLALMCFHASRFDARTTENGELILYEDQDETRWNQELISRGAFFLRRAAEGNQLTKYHLEANIAYWFTVRTESPEKWETVLQLYNELLILEYSSIAALNRTFALSKARGKAAAIPEAEKLQLTKNHFYFVLLGELYSGIDDAKAKAHFERAMKLAKSKAEKEVIGKRMGGLEGLGI